MDHTELVRKFETRQAQIAVVGLGYVGLPLLVTFAQAGYRAVGIELNDERVAAINAGRSYINDITDEELAPFVAASVAAGGSNGAAPPPGPSAADAQPPYARDGSLFATSDFSVLQECDAVSICVPTPLNKIGDPDMSYIVQVGQDIAQNLHAGLLIVLESTTYPGTTREVLLPLLEEAGAAEGLHVGEGYFLAFSPERVDPGRTDWVTRNTPKVIGGMTPACTEVAIACYQQAIETLVPVSSPEAAEMSKLFENTFRAVNIALANELLLMCDKLGLDAWEVVDACATKPFGFMRFTPGPGLGGHCIPIDPQYLSWKLRMLQYNARFVELANEVNTDMPSYWAQKVQDTLNEEGKAVKGSRILLLGIAYKKNVSDLRESPALDIMHLLQAKGGDVVYHDPYVPHFQLDSMAQSSVIDLDQAIAGADCVVITTDHSDYDWEQVRRQARLVVDTRHVIPA